MAAPPDHGAAQPSDSDPQALASVVAARPRPLVVGLDVDGVLAPIVAHAPDSALLPGVLETVRTLAALTPVAVVSGRRLDDLLAFGFAAPVTVFGTHGLERHGHELELEPHEHDRHRRLHAIAEEAATLAGDGAWVEIKRAGVVLHVREAHPERAASASAEALRRAADVTDAHVKPGKAVVEMLVRTTSKADAIASLRQEMDVSTVVFVGDDRSDEEVFAAMGIDDVGVRVGPGVTVAGHRLRDPDVVHEFLRALIDHLASPR